MQPGLLDLKSTPRAKAGAHFGGIVKFAHFYSRLDLGCEMSEYQDSPKMRTSFGRGCAFEIQHPRLYFLPSKLFKKNPCWVHQAPCGLASLVLTPMAPDRNFYSGLDLGGEIGDNHESPEMRTSFHPGCVFEIQQPRLHC